MRRRAFCRLLGAVGLGTVAGCIERQSPGSVGSTRHEWPTFGLDHAHTGARRDASGPDTNEVAWTAVEGAPSVGLPTVSSGRVFVGSAANAVHAFDAESGDLEWEYDTRNIVGTAPAVVGDTVYTAGFSGLVYALDVTDGSERWTHDTDHNLRSRAVAVYDDTLIVGTAGTMGLVVSGDTDQTRAGVVVGLDTESGEPLWTYAEPNDWFTGPAVGDNRVYVGNRDGSVTALNPENGKELWKWTGAGGGRILKPPTYSEESVYVGVHELGRLVALNAADGTQRWSTNLKAPNVKSSPAVDGDRVYVGATGTEANDYDVPDEPSPTPTPSPEPTPTPNEEGVIVVNSEPQIGKISGSVFALSTADGSILSQRGNPALPAKAECSDVSEPRTEQGGRESRKLRARIHQRQHE